MADDASRPRNDLDALDHVRPRPPCERTRTPPRPGSQLLARYGGAVRRYLLGAVQDPDTADDLFQEFAYRFLHGDYRGASPERGRFRNFLKGVISHLVADFCNRRKRQMPGLSDDVAEPAAPSSSESDRLFLESWRDELLVKSWESLAEVEARTGQGFHTVLRYRVDHPPLRSPELAEQVGKLLDRPLTPAAVRQLLHRAREKFGEVLRQHVAASLTSQVDEIRKSWSAELSDLGLLHFLRSECAWRKQEKTTEPSCIGAIGFMHFLSLPGRLHAARRCSVLCDSLVKIRTPLDRALRANPSGGVYPHRKGDERLSGISGGDKPHRSPRQ